MDMKPINSISDTPTTTIAGLLFAMRLLLLVCARLRYAAGTQWGICRYMNMNHLTQKEVILRSDIIVGDCKTVRLPY